MSDSFKRALLDMLRIVEAAIVAELLLALTTGGVDWRRVATSAVIAALKFLDKYLHEEGLAEEMVTGEDSLLTTGISPVDIINRKLSGE